MKFKRVLAFVLSAVIVANSALPAFATENSVVIEETEVQEEVSESELIEEEYKEEQVKESPEENIILEDIPTVPEQSVEPQEKTIVENVYNAMAAYEDGVIASGTAISYTWTIYEDGMLYIEGSYSGSRMNDFSSGGAPWYGYRSSIKSLVTYNVNYIGNYAFYNLNKLEEIDFTNDNPTIGAYAFANCSSLKTLYIAGSSYETIGEYAFANCISLSNISLPYDAKVGKYAFSGCSGLKSVYINSYSGGIFCELAENSFLGVNATVYHPLKTSANIFLNGGHGGTFTCKEVNYGTCGLEAMWQFDANNHLLTISGKGKVFVSSITGTWAPWSKISDEIYTVVIEEGITELSEYLLEYNDNLNSVSLPSTIETLHYNAFNECPNLTSIIIPASVKSFNAVEAYRTSEAFTDTYYLGTENEWDLITNSELVEGKGHKIHFLSYIDKVNATCTQEGTEAYYGLGEDSAYPCYFDANKKRIDNPVVIPATGHAFAWVIDKEATRVETGLKHEECKNCGETQNEGTVIEITGPAIVANGTCNNGKVSWILDEEGLLKVSGTGMLDARFEEFADEIKNVIINEGITAIGNSSFYNCSSLTGISLPEGLTSIGDNAFRDCVSMKQIEFPSTSCSIGRYAFSNTGLESICIKENISQIWPSAFANCVNLSSVDVYNAEALQGSSNIFGQCSNLKEVNFYDSANLIEGGLFNDCTGLESIEIPEGVYQIFNTFVGCTNLKNVKLPESILGIYEEAFLNCTSLRTLYIPKNVEYIDDNVFDGCNGVTIECYCHSYAYEWAESKGFSVELIHSNNKIEAVSATCEKDGNIEYYVCQNCENAFKDKECTETIEINDTVIKATGHNFEWVVDKEATREEAGLKHEECTKCGTKQNEGTVIDKIGAVIVASGTCNGGNAKWTLDEDGLLEIVGIGTVSEEFGKIGYDFKKVIIYEGIEGIGYGAFDGCKSLESIILPEELTSISTSAFEGCSSLTSIKLPENLKSIGSYAFGWCYSLENIILPKGITSINEYTFYSCTNLTSIELSENITVIDDYAFGWCSLLENVVFSEGITDIGNYAFEQCGKLKNITLPEGVVSIGDNAFQGCVGLTSIELPNGISNLGSGAFDNCGFTKITVPEGITSISEGLFAGCRDLESVILPKGITSIGRQAFWDCRKLESIVLPESITSIGSGAFEKCSNLANINLPDDLNTIGTDAFKECNTNLIITYKCSCSSYVNEWVAKNNITFDVLHTKMHKVDKIPATCETAGNIEYYECYECQNVYADENATEEI